MNNATLDEYNSLEFFFTNNRFSNLFDKKTIFYYCDLS